MYEAKGNAKYKTTLERLVEPLYKQEPALDRDGCPARNDKLKQNDPRHHQGLQH